MSIEHWMMFGTFAEQRHFVYPSTRTYQGTVINGNMAAHAPAGLAAFLIEKTPGLPYIIDPLTHAFQHEPSAVINDKGEVRKSIQRMADAYGSVISDRVGHRPLLPRHLEGEKEIAELVSGCLNFQREQIVDHMKSSDAIKYLDVQDKELSPYALVAPYFFMTEATLDRWLPRIARAAELAVEDRQDHEKIFSSIVVSQGIILDDTHISAIVEAFNDIDVDGFLFWVDALDEQQAGVAELNGLRSLASQLRTNGQRDVINLHGGYFSILAGSELGERTFTGVAHGPEFGEYRSVLPVGGGIPIAKYYIPLLHARFRYRDALNIFQELKYLNDAEVFHEKVCRCKECQNTLSGDADNFALFGDSTVRSVRRGHGIVRLQFPTTEAKSRCLQHYLQKKEREYLKAEHDTPEQLIEELNRGINEFEEVLGADGVAHLTLWRNVLSPS